ncbi:TetR family transcriptional regulator (plasmid) [Polaromonas sp. P1-6]|nr:TetR family transcriptional regulator [Polaromonas sp. P1-6]
MSISAVAKVAGVTPALIHNTYPDLAEKIRGLLGKATRTQRDAKHEALVREREINRSLREELARTRADLAKLASINQVLLNEVALLKGMATGKVVSILHSKGADV